MYHMLNLSGCTAHRGGYIMTTGMLELEGEKPELIKTQVDVTRECGIY